MTPLADPHQLTALECARGRESLALYGVLTRGLRPADHHEGIIRAVQPTAFNKGSAVVCPPGSGKSTWISEIAPPWMIGNNPQELILHLHANDEKANAYLTTMQQVFEHNTFHAQIFPDVVPDKDRGWSSRGLYFKWRDYTGKWPIIDKEGWAHQGAKDPQYVSIGFMGGAIGRRADKIILDDPFDPNEIDSKVWRDRFKRRFKTVIKSRLKPGGRIIFVCNRWHFDDMVPELETMGYELVTFPAIIEVRDEAGMLMWEKSYWPEVWSIEALKEIKKDLGATDWNCLYMGHPGGKDGLTFKRDWLQYVAVDEERKCFRVPTADGVEIVSFNACRWFQAVDPAASVKTRADYFVIATVAFHQGRFFIVDLVRRRLEGPDQPDLIHTSYEKWHPYGVGVEKTAYQLTLIQYCVRLGLPIIELPRHGDKESRHKTLAAHYQNMQVFHRKDATWLHDYETELLEQPLSAHDDQVDAVADCCEALSMRNPVLTNSQRVEILSQKHSRVFTGGKW